MLSRLIRVDLLGATGAWRSPARVLIALVLVALTGWSPAWATAQPSDDDTPAGVFGVTVNRDDVPTDLADGAGLVGQWRIEFATDGTYTMSRIDVGVVVTGSYVVDGATVTLTDESGILACGGGVDADPDLAEATYAWELDDEQLTLTPIRDDCGVRRYLLATRTLGGFAACEVPSGSDVPGTGDDGDVSDDVPEDEPVEDETPTIEESLAAQTEDETPTADDDEAAQDEASPEADAPSDEQAAAAEAAIDDLLAQATGCWATGDPTRFLPLHGSEVLDEIESQAPAGFLAQLAELMTQPIAFERVGDVELDGPDHARAYVVLQFGTDEFPLEFEFVREDGRWLLATFFLFELIT